MQPESGLLMSSLTAHILLSKVVRLDTSNMLPFVETILSYSAPNITPYHRGHVIVFTFVARLQNWQVKLLRVHLCFLFQSQATKFMWWHFDQQDRDYRTLEDPPLHCAPPSLSLLKSSGHSFRAALKPVCSPLRRSELSFEFLFGLSQGPSSNLSGLFQIGEPCRVEPCFGTWSCGFPLQRCCYLVWTSSSLSQLGSGWPIL